VSGQLKLRRADFLPIKVLTGSMRLGWATREGIQPNCLCYLVLGRKKSNVIHY